MINPFNPSEEVKEKDKFGAYCTQCRFRTEPMDYDEAVEAAGRHDSKCHSAGEGVVETRVVGTSDG